MRFNISSRALGNALKLAQGTTTAKSPSRPILKNVLIEAGQDGVRLTVSNAVLCLRTRIPLASPLDSEDPDGGKTVSTGLVVEAPGATTIDASKLAGICANLSPDAKVAVVQEDEFVRLTSGRSRFKLKTLPADQYPTLDARINDEGVSACVLPGDVLRAAIARVRFAAAKDDVRTFLNGLLVEAGNDGLTLTGSDAARLSSTRIPSNLLSDTDGFQSASGILPREAIGELMKILDQAPASLSLTPRFLRVAAGLHSMVITLIDGRYPDFRRLLGEFKLPRRVRVPRSDLLRALVHVGLMTDVHRKTILQICGEDGWHMKMLNVPDVDGVQDAVQSVIEIQSEPDATLFDTSHTYQVTAKVDFLREAVNAAAADEIEIQLHGENDRQPVRIDEGDTLHFVMPMRR